MPSMPKGWAGAAGAPPSPLAANGGRVERDGIRRVDDPGVHLEVLEDPVEQGKGALDLDLDVEELAEREEQPRLGGREGDNVTDRRCARAPADGQPAGRPVGDRRGGR